MNEDLSEEDHGESDVFLFPQPFDDEDDDADKKKAVTKEDEEEAQAAYQKRQNLKYGASGKKPKWWKQLTRKGTKGQRKCLMRMTERGFVVKLPPYGEILDVQSLFFGNLDDDKVTSHQDGDNGEINQPETIMNTKPGIILEVGFGDGTNLCTNARNHPNNIYLGADVYEPGVCKLLQIIEQESPSKPHDQDGNDHNSSGVTSSNSVLSNVKVYGGDGIKLLKCLPSNSLSAMLLTFPDPWPNKGHEKWRILQDETLCEMERVLKSGNETGGEGHNNNGIFLLATDAPCFADWTRSLFQARIDYWVEEEPPAREEWLPVVSNYEAKGLREGRTTHCQCWRRK